MRHACIPAVLAVLLAGSAMYAKGPTTRVVVSGGQMKRPVELHDRELLAPFTVWAGRGTRVNGIEATEGFIVDWSGGPVKRKKGLPQFEIAFYANDGRSTEDQLAYVVLYALDAETGQDYVYLPGRGEPHYAANVRSIYRGSNYEGHWWRATPAWQDVMRRYVRG